MNRSWKLVGIFGLLLAAGPIALADISNEIFMVEVCHGTTCVAIYNVPFGQGSWGPDGSFNWTLAEDVVLHNLANPEEVVATIEANDPEHPTQVSILPPGTGRSDPQVNLGFAMTAGNALTTFTVKSALLSFSPYLNPQGRASIGLNVSDSWDGSATLDGDGLLSKTFLSQYNGFVPGGTTFDELIDVVQVNEAFGTVSANDDTLWQPIGGVVSNMSTQIRFTLTANDSASGTSSFQIVPEPASLALLVALALLRRR